jgi:NAD(P) transhydrogenase subunit alpha
MIIGIPAEIHAEEKRVAASPEVVQKFIAAGFEVMVEAGAGAGASFSDDVFRQAGAQIDEDTESVWSTDVIIKVRPPEFNKELGRHETELMKKGRRATGRKGRHRNGLVLVKGGDQFVF